MLFHYINIRKVPWEVLKTAAFGLANVNAWKTMFDPYILKSYMRFFQTENINNCSVGPQRLYLLAIAPAATTLFWFPH